MATPKQPSARGKSAAGKAGQGKAGRAKAAPGKAAPAKAAPGKAAPAPAAAGSRAARTGGSPAPLATVAAPVPVPVPRSVQIAVWLMYAGAVLAALDLIATLATSGSYRSELHRANPAWTAAQLTTNEHSLILSTVVTWAITIGVWVIMARVNSAGRAWARNIATVLSALSTLSFVLYLQATGSLLGKLPLVPMWLVGVAAAILLWRRESTAYIRAGRG
jgi:hypothetical protein